MRLRCNNPVFDAAPFPISIPVTVSQQRSCVFLDEEVHLQGRRGPLLLNPPDAC